MKMNNLSRIRNVVLSLLTGMLSACHDSLLNTVPESVLTEANYYQTANDIDLAVLGIYNRLQSRKPTDYQIMEVPTDNLYLSTNTLIEGTPEMDNLAVTSANPLVATFWEVTYNGIFRANAVLANIDNPSNYGPDEKEQYIGEARFMRALFYFDLVRLFGPVPRVDHLLTVEEAELKPRDPEDDIYHLIQEDLEDAISKLPPKSVIGNGRTNKAAALALLVKMHVYRNQWESAKTRIDQFFSEFGGAFTLVPSFASLWQIATENNNEVLFSMNYLEGINGHNLSTAFLPNSGVIGVVPRGNEIALPSWSLHKKYEAEDTRKTVTIAEWWVPPTTPNDPAIWYPYVNKYAVPHTQGSSGLDLPVLRFADVVLMQAEILYRTNDLEGALQQLNLIRQRAFGNSDHDYTLADISSLEGFLDVLMLERQLEFAFENERWYDLKRFNKLEEVMVREERLFNYATQTSVAVNLTPRAYMNLFPIPLRQIEQSAPDVLLQNDGYD